MPSDRARISYDPTREYRSIVVQQGRVTLEADSNEQSTLQSEALRLETIDIIGPAGTPDDGYAVSINAAKDGLVVAKGTMYVGGWRMTLDHKVELTKQPEWLDQPAQALPAGKSIVALLVTEQTVSAVEDKPLREVALGGPDTAARTRLMQRLIAIPTTEDTCPLAAKALPNALEKIGLAIDEDTLELTSTATLRVDPFDPPTTSNPCAPTAQGGYTGVDNQLVRITVTDYDSTTRKGKLLWGWNDASFLYRASLGAVTNGNQTLTLTPNPIDAEHTPQPNQYVEVLRTSMVLDAVTASDTGNFIAARYGVAAETGAFTPPNLLTIPQLPDLYQNNAYPLFVRLWQGQVAFDDDTSTLIDPASGIKVTIKITALPTGDLAMRPFWEFAVRPSTPQAVYPQRYLTAFQPPVGPRQWLCDLAIVSAEEENRDIKLLANCRIPFLPLTEQTDGGGCCGITLDSAGVTAAGGLQAVVDAQAKKKSSLSLQPGNYQLDAPLALTDAHNGFALSGCGGAVILEAPSTPPAAFVAGLITITSAANITLSGLTLILPVIADTVTDPNLPAPIDIDTMIGIAASSVTGLTVEQCTFTYKPPATGTLSKDGGIVAAGIFLQGACSGLDLCQNTFTCSDSITVADVDSRFLLGIWFTPAAAVTALDLTNISSINSFDKVGLLNHVLDDSKINGNTFTGMTLASVVYAQLGHIECKDNRVLNSSGGFWFIDGNAGLVFEMLLLLAKAAKSNANAGAIEINLEILVALILGAGFLAGLDATTQPTQPAGETIEQLSPEARNIINENFTARAAKSYALLNPNQSAIDAAGANIAETTNNAAPETTTEDINISDTTIRSDTNAIDALRPIYTGFTAQGKSVETVLAVRTNDIVLVSPGEKTSPALLGLLALYVADEKDGQEEALLLAPVSALFIEGNRVQTPNRNSIAVVSYWEDDTIITGNLFRQIGANSDAVVCAATGTAGKNQLTAMANIVHAKWVIAPPPNQPASAIGTWAFYNTVGQ